MPDQKLGITEGNRYRRHFDKRVPSKTDEQTFYRIWKYYLLMASGGHKVDYMSDSQFIGEKNPVNCYKPDIVIPQNRAQLAILLRK
jgi:hypothetical protein